MIGGAGFPRAATLYKYSEGKKVEESPCTVLGLSVEFIELRDGVGQYPAAVVELPDGWLRSVSVDLVKLGPAPVAFPSHPSEAGPA